MENIGYLQRDRHAINEHNTQNDASTRGRARGHRIKPGSAVRYELKVHGANEYCRNMYKQVNRNHSNMNIVFKIVKKPSKDSVQNTGMRPKIKRNENHRGETSNIDLYKQKKSKPQSSSNQQNIELILDHFVILLEGILNEYINYETGTLLKLSKVELYHTLKRDDKIKQLDISVFNKKSFYDFVTTSKENSLQVQDFIVDATASQIEHLISLAKPHLKLMARHRYASYLIGKLMDRSDDLASKCAKIVIKKLSLYIADDYGSRISQLLASKLDWFRLKSIDKFIEHWNEVSKHISAVFYINHVMKVTDKKEELSCLKYCLLERTNELNSSRYFKRIMLSFIRYCDINDFDEISDLVYCHAPLTESLNDHYLALSISLLLERGHPATRHLMATLDTRMIEKLMKIKMFRSLSENIATELPSDYRRIFINNIKNYLVQSRFANRYFEDLPKSYMYALWLVIKYLDRTIATADIWFVNIAKRLYDEGSYINQHWFTADWL